jgi:hypothetical protein
MRDAVNPAVGTWSYTAAMPTGLVAQTLTLTADMSGTVFDNRTGAIFIISDAIVDERNLSFAVVMKIPLKFYGTVDGDAISGAYASDLGIAPVIGTRFDWSSRRVKTLNR